MQHTHGFKNVPLLRFSTLGLKGGELVIFTQQKQTWYWFDIKQKKNGCIDSKRKLKSWSLSLWRYDREYISCLFFPLREYESYLLGNKAFQPGILLNLILSEVSLLVYRQLDMGPALITIVLKYLASHMFSHIVHDTYAPHLFQQGVTCQYILVRKVCAEAGNGQVFEGVHLLP